LTIERKKYPHENKNRWQLPQLDTEELLKRKKKPYVNVMLNSEGLNAFSLS
jgi:hypothetical protein